MQGELRREVGADPDDGEVSEAHLTGPTDEHREGDTDHCIDEHEIEAAALRLGTEVRQHRQQECDEQGESAKQAELMAYVVAMSDEGGHLNRSSVVDHPALRERGRDRLRP